MATPVANTVLLTGDPRIDGLTQGSSWELGSNRELTYSLHNLVPGSVWTNTEINALDRAFDAWEAVANINFRRVGNPNQWSTEGSQADLAVNFTGTFLSAFEPAPLGLALFPDPAFGNSFLNFLSSVFEQQITRTDYPKPEGDIFIDDFSGLWFPYLGAGEIGFEVLLHEIGHSLGLKHPHNNIGSHKSFENLGIEERDYNVFTVMSYNGVVSTIDEGRAATPMFYDILAIQEIYGRNMSYQTGNDVYVLKDDGALRTIWDAGGIDTFDASKLKNPVEIDLEQSLATDNFAYAFLSEVSFAGIAFGVTIENANGGSSADMIIGNGVRNVLRGFGGRDQLFGGSGDDTLLGGFGGDSMEGGPGNDRLEGGPGDDFMYGREGVDTLIGGSGADFYVINSTSELNKALEDPGTDTVNTTFTYKLGPEQEQLTLIGKNDLRGTGNSGNNELFGNSGDNVLSGVAGDDFIYGSAGHDKLKGGAGDDSLDGHRGNDILIGGAGNDSLTGLTGDDIFIFNKEPGVDNVDRIMGFQTGSDVIALHTNVFKDISPIDGGGVGERAI